MIAGEKESWQNWSGTVACRPEIIQPASLEELARTVAECARAGRRLRVAGAGHSFTPLVESDDVLLSLDHLQGLEKVDRERGTAVVLAGTRLGRLGELLLAHGLAQENLGDIDVQSIAGAISTGTHGTGLRFGSLSTQVVALTLVTASGDLIECSEEENRDLFKAAQVSLGALGVIAKVTLRVVPARPLHYIGRRASLEDCLNNLERYRQENEHFEFFWFPYTPWVQAKWINTTEEAVRQSSRWGRLWSNLNQLVLENGVFWLLSEANRLVPTLSATVSRISALGVASVDEIDYPHRIFATPRLVRFVEMEYSLPADQLRPVLEEIRACIEEQRFKVHFPVECRFVKGDDIWLSPAYGRDSAYVAVHMYKGMEYKPYFRHVEAIFRRYEGRPHWGKIHTRRPEELAALYPRWHDFRRLRAQLDPQGIFLNPYLRELFAVDEPLPTPAGQPDLDGF
ncbi:MAG: FAD-binding protein [Thermogemmatispora sp.]|uniref:D-arabinono-1,4-lactone oxidase n=1 Tax=Thermogemmatispora sp. TaxID=1968838 RepID=UPI0019FED740|nr:D-arabinono-1,4-lactone oxidase [Thermogemmatispora sp.]MBE3567804.1 FAD-binding protein [Thermogemmatispora sp.]